MRRGDAREKEVVNQKYKEEEKTEMKNKNNKEEKERQTIAQVGINLSDTGVKLEVWGKVRRCKGKRSKKSTKL